MTRATDKQIEAAASAILNQRAGRRGAPPVSNVKALVPQEFWDNAVEDSMAILIKVDFVEICNALRQAVSLVKAWHCMGMDAESAKATWKIYCDNAPEMQSILQALEKAGS